MPEYDSTIRYAPIPDYPDYVAGTDGSIWSCRTLRGKRDESQWHKLVPVMRDRYYAILLYSSPGSRSLVSVHVAVCRSFHGDCPDGMQCRHLDGNRFNNQQSNLCWGTSTENHADRRIHGTLPQGERHHNSKISSAQVYEMRLLAEQGVPRKKIAAKFNMSLGGVEKIIYRQSRLEG